MCDAGLYNSKSQKVNARICKKVSGYDMFLWVVSKVPVWGSWIPKRLRGIEIEK